MLPSLAALSLQTDMKREREESDSDNHDSDSDSHDSDNHDSDNHDSDSDNYNSDNHNSDSDNHDSDSDNYDPGERGLDYYELKYEARSLVDSLIDAAWENDWGRARNLINEGAKINVSTPDDRTALTVASKRGHYDIVELLLERGADVNMTRNGDGFDSDPGGPTALMYASLEGHFDVVELLLENGAKTEKFGTLRHDDNHIGGPNYSDYMDKPMTALMYASTNGRVDVVKLLLEYNANADAVDEEHNTALMWACSLYSTWVLDQDVDENAERIVELLLDHGATVDHVNDKGQTALIWASERGELSSATDVLLDRGADVNKKDVNGNTALIYIILYDTDYTAKEIDVQLLLERGADPDVVNNDGKKAADLLFHTIQDEEFEKDLKDMFADARGIRARYLQNKFGKIVIAARVWDKYLLKLLEMVNDKKFAPPTRGKKGGSGYYQAELEYMDRLNAGNTSMSFSEFLRARMRGSARHNLCV
tara:strand:+ start:359 stop:1798 length:1440 start_codon:yes stop_codon:yes gene_type:complete